MPSASMRSESSARRQRAGVASSAGPFCGRRWVTRSSCTSGWRRTRLAAHPVRRPQPAKRDRRRPRRPPRATPPVPTPSACCTPWGARLRVLSLEVIEVGAGGDESALRTLAVRVAADCRSRRHADGESSTMIRPAAPHGHSPALAGWGRISSGAEQTFGSAAGRPAHLTSERSGRGGGGERRAPAPPRVRCRRPAVPTSASSPPPSPLPPITGLPPIGSPLATAATEQEKPLTTGTCTARSPRL